MNTKRFGIKVGFAGLALGAGVGCSGADGDGPPVQGATAAEAAAPTEPAELAQQSSHSMIVHATVSLGEAHEVQFVEFRPGMFGLIERGRVMIDVPKVTPEVKRLAWTEQYRHFAGSSAPIPEDMARALARASRAPATLAPESPTTPLPLAPDTESTGDGPHFYTAGEQAWFNQTFCNGVDICVQGFDFTNMQTPGKISSYSAFGMIGAEGTSNGSLNTFYWACGGVWPFPPACYWFPLENTVIVPGHWVHRVLSPQSGSWFFRWELRGGGASTLVSSAADF
jgi:hypothetical protein